MLGPRSVLPWPWPAWARLSCDSSMNHDLWLAVIAAALAVIGGTVGGAISGDIVAKRAFAREHKAQTAAKLADWAFEPLGTAASNLHNIGDEEGINVRLEWRAGA